MFKINEEYWQVVAVPEYSPHLLRSDGTYTVGVCDDELKHIFIASNLSLPFLKKVLCHEIAHAAMFSYNIDLTIEQEELFVDLIATYGQEVIGVTNQMFKKLKGAYSK